MENGINYLKENWGLVLIYFIGFGWLANIIDQPYGFLILAVTVVFVVVFQFLSKKVFKLHKKGPIPWYGSPILWVGGIFFCVWGVWYAVHT